jgi:uncharacterized protein (DUF2345 family)
LVATGNGVFVAAGAGVFVAAGAGVFVAAGAGVLVAAGTGVSVAAGTGVLVAAGGSVGVSTGLVGWNATEAEDGLAKTGSTAMALITSSAAIRITRGAIFMGYLPPRTDPHGGDIGHLHGLQLPYYGIHNVEPA